MSYLITGDRGFVGRHLRRKLETDEEHTIIGLDMLGDYPTIEVLEDFLKRNKVEKIFHLGARAFIPDCYGNEIPKIINSNIVFTGNLLCASQRAGCVKKLLYMSTSEIYGNQPFYPIPESASPNPQSTYSATKFAAENLCRTFGRETGLDIVILRHFNIYGPEDTQKRIIPKILKAAKENKPLTMGNLKITRDFTFVDDTVEAILNIMNGTTENAEIINHGSERETSLREVIEIIEGIYDTEIEILQSNVFERPWDVTRLMCDRRKYEAKFPWHKLISLEEGIKRTADWLDTVGKWEWDKE